MSTERVPKPGELVYRTLDGNTWHWPGPDPWMATPLTPPVDDLDLLNLWAKCHHTLRKVKTELAARGFLEVQP